MNFLKLYSCIVLLFVFSTHSYANELTREEKLHKYVELSGFKKVVMVTKESEHKNAENQAHILLKILKESCPDLPAKYQDMAFNEYKKYTAKIANSYTPKEAISEYTSIISTHFTDDDLDKLIDFYNSQVGRKSVEVTALIAPQFSSFLTKKTNETIQVAAPELHKNIRAILAKHYGKDNDIIDKIMSHFR